MPRGRRPWLWGILAIVSLPAVVVAQNLSARRIEIDRDVIFAEGRVRLVLGACRLTANALWLRRGLALKAEQACLIGRGGKMRIEAHRLRFDGRSLQARWATVELCRCPQTPTLALEAARASVGPSWRRLLLEWPVLRVGRLPIFTAPFWALPLKSGTSGLLAPEVGYSGRDGLRLYQGAHLAWAGGGVTFGGGWITHRGLQSRLSFTHADSRLELDLGGLALLSARRSRFLGRGQVVARKGASAFAVWLDASSDERLLAEIAAAPDRVFAPYLRSRALLVLARGPVYAHAVGDVLQDLRSPRRSTRGRLGRGGIQLGLVPVAIAGPLLFFADLSVQGSSAALRGQGRPPASLVLAELAPNLAVASMLGSFSLAIDLGYRGQLVLPRWGRRQRELAHRGLAAAEVGLPLLRLFRRGNGQPWLRHRVEPYLGWQALWGGSRLSAGGRRLSVREGGQIILGLRNSLRRPSGRALATMSIAVAAGLDGRLLLTNAFRLGGAEDGLRAHSTWDVRALSSVMADVRICHRLFAGRLRLCGAYLRLRVGDQAELAAIDGARWSELSWLERLDRGPRATRTADQVSAAISTRWRWLAAGAAIAVDPTLPAMTHARYWADAVFGCGCYRLGLVGRSRRGQTRPDLMLRFSLAPARDLGCLAGGGF